MVDAIKQSEEQKKAEVTAANYHKQFASVEDEVKQFPFSPLKQGVAVRFPIVDEKTKLGIIKSPQMLKDEKNNMENKLGSGKVSLDDYGLVVAVGPEAYLAGLRPGHRVLARGTALELVLPGIPKGVYGHVDYYDILGFIKGTEVVITNVMEDL